MTLAGKLVLAALGMFVTWTVLYWTIRLAVRHGTNNTKQPSEPTDQPEYWDPDRYKQNQRR
jgi:hypothetical protein